MGHNLLCVDAACRKTRDSMSIPKHQIRATYDAETITVYQAYSPAIADPAVAAGTFAPPFSLTRMTWIKPSFLWMMYRCGWARKPGQERVLAVRITRAGFESALSQACLSHFDRDHHTDRDAWRNSLRRSPVRIQWDPERTPTGTPLPHRSLQIGLGPEVVPAYVNEWIVGIDDITEQLPAIRSGAQPHPTEMPYPLATDIAAIVGSSA